MFANDKKASVLTIDLSITILAFQSLQFFMFYSYFICSLGLSNSTCTIQLQELASGS